MDAKGSARIIIAEDEKIVALDIKNILLKKGYKVLAIVNTSDDIIKEAKKNLPDLVIMDIMLKGSFNGIKAAKRISSSVKVPILYISGLPKDQLVEFFNEDTFYLSKPFSQEALLSSIEDVINLSIGK